jgi:hypothetical protein
MKIISGAQTGADRAALEWALDNGVATGGWMPAGFRAEDGKHPEFERLYGIKCTSDWRYPPRTELNVRDSAVTLIFGDVDSAGCSLTRKLCAKHRKPFLHVPFSAGEWPGAAEAKDLIDLVQSVGAHKVWNVAGNREHKNPGIGDFVKYYLGWWYKLQLHEFGKETTH